MTDLATPPATHVPGADAPTPGESTPGRGDFGTVVTGSLAALWAMAAGLLGVGAVVLVFWLVDGRTGASAGATMQITLQGYLLAHGGALTTSWGPLSVIPLGLTGVPAWLLYRGGLEVARRRGFTTLPGAAEAVASITIVYAVLAVLLTSAATTSGVTVSALRAGGGAAVLAALASGAAVLRESGLLRVVLAPIPGPSRAVLRAAVAGVVALIGLGALVVAVAVGSDPSGYAELSRAVAPTWTGAVGLAVVCVLVLPNAVLYAVAVAVGPGFALGTGTGVSAFGVQLGPVPALPLLAALPDGTGTPILAYAALAAPLLAGVAVGAVCVRRFDEDDERGVIAAMLWAGLSGILAGGCLGALTAASAGSLGSQALATVGPVGWEIGALAAAELAVVAAVSAGILRFLERRTRAV